MSLFQRPDSPPPRMPSPDIVPIPLPSRPRKSSIRRVRPTYPLTPPGLPVPPSVERRLHSTRSCNNLDTRRHGLDGPEFFPRGQSSRDSSTSPPTTPQSLPISSPAPRRVHCRTLSVAIPSRSRSPPPSPTIAPPPPPVPPIPACALAPTDKKPVLHRKQSRLPPVYLPDIISPISEIPMTTRMEVKSAPMEAGRGVGMTCLKFFSLRNAGQRGARTSAV